MPEYAKLEELRRKLAPCIERGALDECADEAARLAGELEISAQELLNESSYEGEAGRYELAYVLALAAAQGLEGTAKAGAYYNAGLAAKFLKKPERTEENYKKAIEADPNDAPAHSNYAILLKEQKRIAEAESEYKRAIEANPNYAPAHGAYGLLLVDFDRRNDALNETEIASRISKENGEITVSHLATAWFYQAYSEKNLKRKKFRDSGEDSGKAGEACLRAAETADSALRDNLQTQGYILMARSFIRKIPEESWFTKILRLFGRNQDLSELYTAS